jgi:hypothetical protein
MLELDLYFKGYFGAKGLLRDQRLWLGLLLPGGALSFSLKEESMAAGKVLDRSQISINFSILA